MQLAVIWAAATTVVQIALTLGFMDSVGRKVWNAYKYREIMFLWVRTGVGPEGNIKLFLPVHLKQLAVFSLLSLASGGLLGLMMGSALLGYMNFYAGSLISLAANPWMAAVFCWPVYAVVRVVGYIIAGTALGAVLLDKSGQKNEKKRKILRFLSLALALIVLDIAVKWAIAGSYQGWLMIALDG